MMHGELINQLTEEVNKAMLRSPELRKLVEEARQRGLEMTPTLKFRFAKSANTPDNSWLDALYSLEDRR